MGQLFSYLYTSGSEQDFLVAGSDASLASEEDQALHAALCDNVEAFESVILEVPRYKGNEVLIKNALSSPNDREMQKTIFKQMLPNIEFVRRLFVTSSSVNKSIINVIELAESTKKNSGDDSFASYMSDHASIMVQFACIMKQIFVIDWAKIEKPSIQNDFSFYRREMGKMIREVKLPVNDTDASFISMFVAQSSPFLHAAVAAIISSPVTDTVAKQFFADFADACIVSTMTQTDPDLYQTTILAALTSAVIYDQLSDKGIFARSSPINLKKIINGIRKIRNDKIQYQAWSTIRYSIKSFNRAPSSVRRMVP